MPHMDDEDFSVSQAVTQPKQEMSMGRRLAFTAEAFGAGMRGEKSMFQAQMEQAAQQKRAEIEGYYKGHQLFKEKFDMLDSVDADHRPMMTKIFAGQIEQLLPGGGKAFMAMANSGPDVYKTALDLLGDPDAATTAAEVYSGRPGAIFKDISKPEFLKSVLALHDQKKIPIVTDKLRKLKSKGLDLPEELQKRVQSSMTRDGFFQMDTRLLEDINNYLVAKGDTDAMTGPELRTLFRNPAEFISLGIVPVETTQAAQKEQLLKEEDLVGTNAAGQLITRNKLTGALQAVGTPPPAPGTVIQGPLVAPQGPVGLDPNKIIDRYSQDRGVRRFVYMKENVNTLQRVYGNRVGGKLILDYDKGNAAADRAAVLGYLQTMHPEWEDIKEEQAADAIRKMGNIPSGIATSLANTLRGERLNREVFNEIMPFIFARFKVANEEQKQREAQYRSQMTRAPGGDPSDIEIFSQGKPTSILPPKVSGVPTPQEAGFATYVRQYAKDAAEQGFDANQIDAKVKKHFGDDGVKLLRQDRQTAAEAVRKTKPVKRDRAGQPINEPLIRPVNPRQRGYYGFGD